MIYLVIIIEWINEYNFMYNMNVNVHELSCDIKQTYSCHTQMLILPYNAVAADNLRFYSTAVNHIEMENQLLYGHVVRLYKNCLSFNW